MSANAPDDEWWRKSERPTAGGPRGALPTLAYRDDDDGRETPPSGVRIAAAVPSREDMRAAYDDGDFASALATAEAILAHAPEDEEAKSLAESARLRLRHRLVAKLGSLLRVPHVALAPGEISRATLDHRAGFVLSCIDGRLTVEEILDVAPMSQLETLRILLELVELGAITLT